MERDENRRAEFNANNMRLFLKGLPLEVWEEPSEEDLDPESATIASADEEEEKKEEDPLLRESSFILIDMAKALGNPMTANNSGALNSAAL